MGAGQIGGIATLLGIDFNNAAGFVGKPTEPTEAQYVVYFLSHAVLFCAGALLEPHVVITPAVCVFGERNRFDVFGGTHLFLDNKGAQRPVYHIARHKSYNETANGHPICDLHNIAILVLAKAFLFDQREPLSDFIMNRVRYGVGAASPMDRISDPSCAYFGWGSRRNGYMVPLLIHLFKVDAKLLPVESCDEMWNHNKKFLCLYPQQCKSSQYGALCPDDIGSVLVCSGFLQGLMITQLVDRPCGVGWLDMINYVKFLTCAIDDAQNLVAPDDDDSVDLR